MVKLSERSDRYIEEEGMSTHKISLLISKAYDYIQSKGQEALDKYSELCDNEPITDLSYILIQLRLKRFFSLLALDTQLINVWIEEVEIEWQMPLNRLSERLQDAENISFNANNFHEHQPYCYDKTGLFWFWNFEKSRYESVDEIDVMNAIDRAFRFSGYSLRNKIKGEYIEALKRIGRLNMPETPQKSWVQFKKIIFDIATKKKRAAHPKYFVCNPIPWDLGKTDETPILDKMFTEWVGEKYLKTLYEIVAYCTIIDYPIHLIICLTGCGRNGKSTFLNLLIKFLGKENCASTELDDLIDNRFETSKMYKKLLVTLGETNFEVMQKTSKIKKLVGQDLIGYEFKNKAAFDDFNYAKVLIASNSLPISDDTSEGFYRRWLIIDFPNIFPEGHDILTTIPDSEYEALARKCCKILPELLERGLFTNMGTVEERQQRYILASNPFPEFMKQCCDYGHISYFVRGSELRNAYTYYLMKHKKRVVGWKGFKEALEREGIFIENTSKLINDIWVRDRFAIIIQLKENWKEIIDAGKNTTITTDTTHFDTSYTYIVTNREMSRNSCNSSINTEKQELIMEYVVSNEEKEIKSIDNVVSNKEHIDSPEEIVMRRLKRKGELEITDDFIKTIARMKNEGKVFEFRPGWIKLV